MQIFNDHRRLAQWHFKLQTEICLLKQRRSAAAFTAANNVAASFDTVTPHKAFPS